MYYNKINVEVQYLINILPVPSIVSHTFFYLANMADKSDRQTRIMEHLARSTNDFIKPKLDSVDRKQRIMEHIRLTKG